MSQPQNTTPAPPTSQGPNQTAPAPTQPAPTANGPSTAAVPGPNASSSAPAPAPGASSIPASAPSTATAPAPAPAPPAATSASASTSAPALAPAPAPAPAGPPEPSAEDQFWAARRDEEIARRDRSLAELLVMLDGYKPLIPEEVTEYFLQRSGFDCNDPRLKRLLSLVAQKFIADLSRDAYHFSKLRVNGAAAGRGRPAAGVDRNRVVLTMDDLSLALGEHGVNVKKPDYYL
ncbi:hypothetical protein IAT38_003090 [Cryptococcus sp. DSM 104549]